MKKVRKAFIQIKRAPRVKDSRRYFPSITGFTLLETIIVLITLSILVGIGMGQYARAIEKARGAEAQEILFKCYAAYQRRLIHGEDVSPSTINAMGWSFFEMENPNLANSYFSYAMNPPRVTATRISDSSKYLRIEIDTGILTKTDPY